MSEELQAKGIQRRRALQLMGAAAAATTAAMLPGALGSKADASSGETPLNVYDVTNYGASPSNADNEPYIADAIAAAGSAGGIIFFPPGLYQVESTITIPAPSGSDGPFFVILGSGRENTTIEVTTNNPALSFIGTSSTHTAYHAVKDITFESSDSSATYPVVVAEYASTLMFMFVDWQSGVGGGFSGEELWDSYFYGCRFNNLGSSTAPAFALTSSTGNSSNNIWMVNCVFESFDGTALALVGGSSGGALLVNDCFFVNTKLERSANSTNLPFILCDYCFNIAFDNLTCTMNAGSGSTSSQNFISLTGDQVITLRDVLVETSSAVTFGSGVTISSSTRVLIDGLAGSLNLAPSTALVTLSGSSNTGVSLSNIDYFYVASGSAPLVSGASPSVSLGSGAGSGSSVTSTSSNSVTRGSVTIKTGTSTSAGALATVTLAAPLLETPTSLLLTPLDSAAASALTYGGSLSSTSFKIESANAPSASTTLSWSYELSV